MVARFIARHQQVLVLLAVVVALTIVPVLETVWFVGDEYRGIVPPFSDEIYPALMHTIGSGHLTAGNPYFLEHSNGVPLVIFAGAWLDAIPLWLGLSLPVVLQLNFILWSMIYAATAYRLLRELRLPAWGATAGTLLLYIQSYEHVWRPVALQTVYPFYFLFYALLLRLMRQQSRKNTIVLGFVVGSAFYFYSYLWQTAVITLGLLFLYALVRRNWSLLKATLISSTLGGVIGSPAVLYAMWLSHTSPYFWESVDRLGLVDTHLPMAEVIYTGGWIGVVLALLALLLWRAQALRENAEFTLLATFLTISGLGLWIMQGSNLITGKLLETGEHMVGLIMPWLLFAVLSIVLVLWRQRALLSSSLRVVSAGFLLVVSLVAANYANRNIGTFLPPNLNPPLWRAQQEYAKPLAWFNGQGSGLVVWSDPHDGLTTLLPMYTKDFVLDANWGMFQLVPEGETRERYLVSQYFNNPSLADLKTSDEMSLYLGRHDLPHQANTIARGIKICRILFFWDTHKNCGTPPTPQELLGDQVFAGLEAKFQTDIVPNIKAYLAKYHVTYILKDDALDPNYRPETLGATLVYHDERFEIYQLPSY